MGIKVNRSNLCIALSDQTIACPEKDANVFNQKKTLTNKFFKTVSKEKIKKLNITSQRNIFRISKQLSSQIINLKKNKLLKEKIFNKDEKNATNEIIELHNIIK